MQVIFVILLHIDYTLNAKHEIFLKYLLFKRKIPYFYYKKLDIENPIIRINTAFKGCSSLEKISVLPRIYHN